MKAVNTITKSIVTLSAAACLSSAYAGDTDNTSIHGTACAAASLGQAINFGTSWSQFGIRNPNTVASGRSFFVICPIVIDADEDNRDPETDIRVHPTYQDLSTSILTCSARRYDIGGNLLKSVNFVSDSATPQSASLDSFANELRAENVIDSADGWLSLAYDESAVVVCALPPQAGISAVTTRKTNGL